MTDSNFVNNKPLRTHKRLDSMINEYNDYLEELEKNNSGFKKASPNTYVPKYKYYHFQLSPQGIDTFDVGMVLQTLFSTYVPSWRSSVTTNTTNSWLIQLGTMQQSLHEADEKYIKLNSSPGFILQNIYVTNNIIDVLSNPELVYNKNIQNATYTNSIDTSYIDLTNIFVGTTMESSYVDSVLANRRNISHPNIIKTTSYGLSNKDSLAVSPSPGHGMSSSPGPGMSPSPGLGMSPSPSRNTNVNNYMCYEYTSYFKPEKSGYYTFSYSVGTNNYFMMWLGNNGVSNYLLKNSVLNPQTNQYETYIDATKYTFVRIQVYLYNSATNSLQNKKSKLDFQLTVTNPSGSTSSPFHACKENNAPYYPTLLYASFVSNSAASYKLGEFNCYSQLDTQNEIPKSEVLKLYDLLNVYKVLANKGTYESYDGSDQYGELPNGIYYSPTQDGQYSKPYAFYLYYIQSDPRLGKTFQVDTTMNSNGQYEMINLPPKFVEKSNNYTLYEKYYPTSTQLKNAIDANTLETGTKQSCQELCDANPNCNYFYSFQINKSGSQGEKCFLDNTNSNPSFNQINPVISNLENIQTGSSNLYIRNNEFSDEVQKQCSTIGKGGDELVEIQNIEQTTSYGSSFPYSNYYIDEGAIMKQPSSIGICAPKKKMEQYNQCFKDVLFRDGQYEADGTFLGNPNCITTEGFDTLNTNAVSNTQQQGIDYVKNQEAEFTQNMDSVSKNYSEIRDNLIPSLEKMQKEVNESGYNQLQNNKLVSIGKPLKNAAQQSIEDNNSMYVKQNLIYILAVLTIFVLLVFMYVL